MAIRFKEEDVRDMGKSGRGVIGIRDGRGRWSSWREIPTEGNSVVTVSEKGFWEGTSVIEYRLQSGVEGDHQFEKPFPEWEMYRDFTGHGDEDIMLISDTGNIIRVKVESCP